VHQGQPAGVGPARAEIKGREHLGELQAAEEQGAQQAGLLGRASQLLERQGMMVTGFISAKPMPQKASCAMPR